MLDSDRWGVPQQIPLLDYNGCDDLDQEYADGNLVIKDVTVGPQPTLLTLRRVAGR